MADENLTLDDLLNVGHVITLQPGPSEAAEHRVSAYIRGWQPEEYILVDVPEKPRNTPPLRPGQRCVLRFMIRGIACGFTSSISDLGSGPFYTYTRLLWPSEIRTLSLRGHERIDLRIPCTVENAPHGSLSGHILDLSVGGCRISLPKPLKPGISLRASFVLPDGAPFDNVECVVRKCQPTRDGANVGCSFSGLTPLQTHDIEFHVANAIAQQRLTHNRSAWALVIDPEPGDISHLQSLLEKKSIEITVAGTAIAGINRLSLSPPAALLINHDLAGCSGFDVLRIIRSSPRTGSLPVYLYGSTEPSFAEKAKQAGATGVFPSLDDGPSIVKAVSKNVITAATGE